MTAGGWFMLIISVSTVTLLFIWCMWKVLSTPGETDHVHGFEIETPDEKEEREREKRRSSKARSSDRQ